MRQHRPDDCTHPTIGETWELGRKPHDEGWIIQRWIVREHGIVLQGKAPLTLIDPVGPDELRLATQTLLQRDWSQRLHTPDWFAQRRYQAYGVLTMCRSAFTMATGKIATKPAAAAWARETFPHRAALIDCALSWQDERSVGDPSETLDFIGEVVGRHA